MKSSKNKDNIFKNVMVWLFISGLIVLISYFFIYSNSSKKELGKELPREKQFIEEVSSSKTLETKDTIIGRRYVREGQTENYYFKVIKTDQCTSIDLIYKLTSINVSGEFIKKNASLNQWQILSQKSLDRVLSKLQKKESWDEVKNSKMEISPMGI